MYCPVIVTPWSERFYLHDGGMIPLVLT
jgi:hypothetical protein